MKDYNEYMDMVIGDADLKKKIKERIRMETSKIKGSERFVKNDKRYRMAILGALAATACAAFVFAVIVLPGILDRPAIILPEDSPLGYGEYEAECDIAIYEGIEGCDAVVDDDSTTQDESDTQASPDTPIDGEIYFNRRAAVLDDFYICTQDWLDFGFSYTLANEQVEILFPAVDLPLWSWAIFCRESNFVEIQASVLTEHVDDILAAGDDVLAAIMTRTRMRISERAYQALAPRIQHRVPDPAFIPLVSIINGVEVTAVVYTDTMHDPFFFRTSFNIDGVYYLVEAGETCVETGMSMVSELVYQLIASSPVDLPIVPSRLN